MKQALSANPNIKEPDCNFWFKYLCKVPYTDGHVVGQHNRLYNGNVYFLQS